MIRTLLRVHWLGLRRDRIALAMTFIMPVLFFSIFAVIFGSMGQSTGGADGEQARIRVVLVDLDRTDVSRRLAAALADQKSLDVRTMPPRTPGQPNPPPYTRDQAAAKVRTDERYPVAVIIPRGFSQTFGDFAGTPARVELLYNPANLLAYQAVGGLLQAAAMQAAPDVLMQRGLATLEAAGGTLTDTQRRLVQMFTQRLRNQAETTGADADGSGEGDTGTMFASGLVQVEAHDVRAMAASQPGAGTNRHSMVAYYVAGISVMFLLFSMAGAGGALLDEVERGTLERILTTRVGMGRLLAGNWLFFFLVGLAQVVVMFVWAAEVFELELWTPKRIAGCAAMTLVTVAAAAAFGLVLATLCRTRAQLHGGSTILILIMSALGGSMIPRFIMPAFMETTAKFTFNGWALDGYLKVFWYDNPADGVWAGLIGLTPQLVVLAAMAVVMVVLARVLARRWETS